MMMDWRRLTRRISLTIFFLFCIYNFAAIYTANNNNPQRTPSVVSSSVRGDYKYFQNYEKNKNREMAKSIILSISGGSRKLLGGLGSSPPRCTSKCGMCTPCNPVHVSVPPRMRVTSEYYPEAWRCKCGNRLYMP